MGETKWALRQKRTRDVTKIHILTDIERSFRSNRFRHSTHAFLPLDRRECEFFTPLRLHQYWIEVLC